MGLRLVCQPVHYIQYWASAQNHTITSEVKIAIKMNLLSYLGCRDVYYTNHPYLQAMIETSTMQSGGLTSTGLSEAAFTQLYNNNLTGVLNYICYRLGPDEAEDLTAHIFAQVWARRGAFDERKGSLNTWLWAIVRNAITDQIRQKYRHPPPTELLPGSIKSNNLLDDISRREEWQTLRTALKTLNPLDQDIIALRFGAGHTNRDIAALLTMGEANVAQRLRRALHKLRLTLEEQGSHHD
jgi:RNA polymerase sigma-70 factor (ECF subfamily)